MWKDKVGKGAAVKWPATSSVGGKGNEGVASFVTKVPNTIGYVEYAYVKQNKMTHVQLQNAANNWVQPDEDAFRAAAAGADWQKSFYQILTNQPGKDSWPISGATFILIPIKNEKPELAQSAIKFFLWAFDNGAKAADDLDYVTLPKSVLPKIKQEMAKVK